MSHLGVLLRQLPFATVFLLFLVGVILYATEDLTTTAFFGAVLAFFTATALSVAVPWRRVDHRWSAVVPLLDILAVGLVIESGFPAAVLLVFPVLWMSMTFGITGVVVSVLGGTAAAWGENLIDRNADIGTADVPRLVLLPIVLAAVGLSFYLSERRSAARRELLARQSALVEEALADSRQQRHVLDSILNTIDVGVVALDAYGTITTINRAHADVVGHRLNVGDEVTRHGGIDGYAADGVTPLGTDGSPLVRASRGQTIERELTWWDNGDGTRTAFRISASQLGGPGRDDAGAVVAYQDLTAEMTALAQREDVVSSVTHELRTPLTAMLGYLELTTDDDELPERLRRQLQVVERNAERLQRLIDDLLLAARTRGGFVDVTLEPVDLCDVLGDAVQSQSPRATAGGVTVELVTHGPCVVAGDATRLAQVVDNVLSNAVKYSRRGGHVVAEVDQVDSRARVRVRDEGIGIPEGEQEKVFSRFYRSESVRGGSVPGTGLGLHITRQIVLAHHGTIELRSTPGVGTEVTITLPLYDAPPPAPEDLP